MARQGKADKHDDKNEEKMALTNAEKQHNYRLRKEAKALDKASVKAVYVFSLYQSLPPKDKIAFNIMQKINDRTRLLNKSPGARYEQR